MYQRFAPTSLLRAMASGIGPEGRRSRLREAPFAGVTGVPDRHTCGALNPQGRVGAGDGVVRAVGPECVGAEM